MQWGVGLLWVLIITLLCSCAAPVSLTYESARTLQKGQVDVQANCGRYVDTYHHRSNYYNYNYGAKIGYGLTDRYTIKLRYEHIAIPSESLYGPAMQDLFRFFFFDYPTTYNPRELDMHYYEIDNKIRIDEHSTFSIPLGYYSVGVYSINLRYYLTVTSRAQTLDATFIAKAHVLVGKNSMMMPGIGIGFGASSNLNRWAFRPEIGWDGYLAVGAALTVSLRGGK